MGRVRHEWKTPKKARFFGLLERGMSIPAAAKELKLDRTTAWRWTKKQVPEPNRRTRPQSEKKLGVSCLTRDFSSCSSYVYIGYSPFAGLINISISAQIYVL